MPLLRTDSYTADDYWNLPNGEHAELINGQLITMATPSRTHQRLSLNISRRIANYIDIKGGPCEVIPAPFAVNLNADDKTYVEPDISVVCDPDKLTEHECKGAPDFIIEIVSPTKRKHDYSTKNTLYSDAGVREYWIVDPDKERTTIYRYEEDAAPIIIPFDDSITVGIYGDLSITIRDLV